MGTTQADRPTRRTFLNFLAASALLHVALIALAWHYVPRPARETPIVLHATLVDGEPVASNIAAPGNELSAASAPVTPPAPRTVAAPPAAAKPQASQQPTPASATEIQSNTAAAPPSTPPAIVLPETPPETSQDFNASASDAPAPSTASSPPPQDEPIARANAQSDSEATSATLEPSAPANEPSASVTAELPSAQNNAPTKIADTASATQEPVSRVAQVIVARTQAPLPLVLPGMRHPDVPNAPRIEPDRAPQANEVIGAAALRSGAAVMTPQGTAPTAAVDAEPMPNAAQTSSRSPVSPPAATPPSPPPSDTASPASTQPALTPAPIPPAPIAATKREVPIIVAKTAQTSPESAVIVPKPSLIAPTTSAAPSTPTPSPNAVALAQPAAVEIGTASPERIGALPVSADIDYELSRGVFRGSLKLNWRRDGTRYRIATHARALFMEHDMESLGAVGAQGLAPEVFVEKMSSKKSEVKFDRQSNTLQYNHTDRDSKSQPLESKTQDPLSSLFQFALMQPPASGVMTSTITTSRRIEQFEYEIAGRETLKIAGSSIETLRLRPRDPKGRRTLEVWLAVDNHHLPVKVRDTDKKGNVTEMLATRIRVE